MTPLEIIKDAMLETGEIQSGEEPSAEETSDYLGMWNDWVFSQETAGMTLNHTTAALNDVLPYPDNHKRCFVFNLAVEMCPGLGIQPKPTTAVFASDTLQLLKNYYLVNPLLRVDDMLHPFYEPNRYFVDQI